MANERKIFQLLVVLKADTEEQARQTAEGLLTDESVYYEGVLYSYPADKEPGMARFGWFNDRVIERYAATKL